MVDTNAVPPSAVHTDATKIATGNAHSMVLKTDGTVWTTGWVDYGQLGNGKIINKGDLFVNVFSGQ